MYSRVIESLPHVSGLIDQNVKPESKAYLKLSLKTSQAFNFRLTRNAFQSQSVNILLLSPPGPHPPVFVGQTAGLLADPRVTRISVFVRPSFSAERLSHTVRALSASSVRSTFQPSDPYFQVLIRERFNRLTLIFRS